MLPGLYDLFLSIQGKSDSATDYTGSLLVRMFVNIADCAGLEMDFHQHHFFTVQHNPAAHTRFGGLPVTAILSFGHKQFLFFKIPLTRNAPRQGLAGYKALTLLN